MLCTVVLTFQFEEILHCDHSKESCCVVLSNVVFNMLCKVFPTLCCGVVWYMNSTKQIENFLKW